MILKTFNPVAVNDRTDMDGLSVVCDNVLGINENK